MIYRFKEVIPGVFRGSAPALKDVAGLVRNFKIKKIVSLDKKEGEKIKKICKSLGIKHIIFPLYGKRSDVLKVLNKDLKKLFIDDGPVFIHCRAGKDRTGFIAALLRVMYDNEDPEDAIDEAKSLGFGYMLPKQWQKAIKLYEDAIRKAKPIKDKNSADTVLDLSRDYNHDDYRGSPLNQATQHSLAPYVDTTRKYPYDNQYVTELRLNDDKQVGLNNIITNNVNSIPYVGTYDNATGIRGVGPTENSGGFLHD